MSLEEEVMAAPIIALEEPAPEPTTQADKGAMTARALLAAMEATADLLKWESLETEGPAIILLRRPVILGRMDSSEDWAARGEPTTTGVLLAAEVAAAAGTAAAAEEEAVET